MEPLRLAQLAPTGLPAGSGRRRCHRRPASYRLRGSFVSLLLWEGHSLAYVAEQAGHSIATLAKHYAGVIRELEDKPRISAAEAIYQARASVRGTQFGRARKRRG